MVSEAITSLKERTGSSSYAIAKFVEDKHKDKLPPNFRKLLNVQLKKLVAGGKLTKVKNSYKLSSAATKPNPKPKAAPKKPKTGAKKPKAAAKTKAKTPAKAKPATKPKPAAKPKAVVKPKTPAKPKAKPAAKAKPKTAGAKPKPLAKKAGRPAKAAKTSAKDTPGKK
ncbi:hypothetical protein ACJX0J_023114, partial [Zea mays]